MASERTILPAFLFPGRTSTERRHLARLVEARKIRPAGPRLYTSLSGRDAEKTMRSEWASVLANLYPKSLISHRTALEFTPSPDGLVVLTGTTSRVVDYVGLRVRFVRGPGALADDRPFMGLHASSLPRALLENLQPLHQGSRDRVVTRQYIEHRIEQILHVNGESELLAIRDRAREIARGFAWERAFEQLDKVIGLLLGTRTGAAASALGRARSLGEPFDLACSRRLDKLSTELMQRPLASLRDTFTGPDHFENKAFFEAYFSNFIEGTRFPLEEAERIVFDHVIPPLRPQDAHDILGTWKLVGDPNEMRKTPASHEQFVSILQTRHRVLMDARPDVNPGQFKTRRNIAGDTTFVDPEYVAGTLRRGYERYAALPPGLARAVFMMFLVSDVHPFDDGNGRIARMMMNAELVATGDTTIIIPIGFRETYVDTLRALTRRERPTPLVDALVRARAFSHLSFSPYADVLATIRERNWFREQEGRNVLVDLVAAAREKR